MTGMNPSSLSPHLHKNSHSLLMNRMGNRSSWKSKTPHPHSNTKKALPARLQLSLCCVQTGQSAEFCLKQPSLGMWDSLRLHLETIFPPSLFPSVLPCSEPRFPVQHHKQLRQHGAEQGPLLCPGLGRAGAAAKEKSLQLGPANQVNASSLPRPSHVLCCSPNIYVFVKHINISSEVSYSQRFMWSCCFHAPKPPSVWLIHTGGVPDLPHQSHGAQSPMQRSKSPKSNPQIHIQPGKGWEVLTETPALLSVPNLQLKFLFPFFFPSFFFPLPPSKSVCSELSKRNKTEEQFGKFM